MNERSEWLNTSVLAGAGVLKFNRSFFRLGVLQQRGFFASEIRNGLEQDEYLPGIRSLGPGWPAGEQ